jgi:hypothetical protein
VSPRTTDTPTADAAWLHMDRPTNLMVINSVMLFDERLDEERLREVIRKRLVEPYRARGGVPGRRTGALGAGAGAHVR